jgi:L-threonylcarbamoyladenylate synthase
MAEITQRLDLAIARLGIGGLVAIPTETVYGLAAAADDPEAVARVFALKGRPPTNPLIVHIHDAAGADQWACSISQVARDLMQAFWPGPLTLVLPARPEVSRQITAGQNSVALRVPAHPLALALLAGLGKALVAPSANRYMAVSPTSAVHVARQFPGEDLLILDGGPCEVGLESTILAVLPDQPLRLLRPGMLGTGAIEAVTGLPVAMDNSASIRVPGQHERHYAPATPAFAFSVERVASNPALLNDPLTGWILCGGTVSVRGPCLDLGKDPSMYARLLYDALYQFDAMNLRRIQVQQPPGHIAWGAIHNRLSRALRKEGD